jgi:S-adenosylmethionine decarboxylase
MPYLPGTHIIASLSTTNAPLLQTFAPLQTALDTWITEHHLTKLGEVYHNFAPAGFTAVICLSESHISFHTWPEFGRVNLDIYLSNHKHDNEQTTQKLYNQIVKFFEATILTDQTIKR